MFIESLSKYLFYPLWDFKDKSPKLRILKALLNTQKNSLEVIKNKQWDDLLATVDYAGNHSPYYKKVFTKNSIDFKAIKTIEDFRKIPVTTKLDIRNNLEEFISDQYKKEELLNAKTGGSTGVSLDLYFDQVCEFKRNAAAMRSDMWAGWDLGHKKAAVWGNPPVPTSLKEKIRHHCLDRMIFLDTMGLSDKSMGEFVKLWDVEKPKAVFGHAHSIYIFAQYLVKNNITTLQPSAIVATSMMLLDHERAVINTAFNCEVTNRYGCEEVGLIASECELHDGMHLNIEHLFIEFLDNDGQPVKEGEFGNITLTDFNNKGMPLIRYQVGDIGVATSRKCKCGRGLPIMERLEGRTADFLKTESGTLVSGISMVERTLTDIPGIEQMQIIQPKINEIKINRVKGIEYNESTDVELVKEFKAVFGENSSIIINDIDAIAQEKSGKYRFSKCEIN